MDDIFPHFMCFRFKETSHYSDYLSFKESAITHDELIKIFLHAMSKKVLFYSENLFHKKSLSIEHTVSGKTFVVTYLSRHDAIRNPMIE